MQLARYSQTPVPVLEALLWHGFGTDGVRRSHSVMPMDGKAWLLPLCTLSLLFLCFASTMLE